MSEKYIRFAADKLSRAGFTDIQYVTDDEQGADILATAKSGAHVCIKCVYTDKPVTANAVNDVYQAKKAYGCNAAMVITNSTFTEKAEEYAGKAKVSLKAGIETAQPSETKKTIIEKAPLKSALTQNTKVCPMCRSSIDKKAKICPVCGKKVKKPLYKRGWFVLFVAFMIVGFVGSVFDTQENEQDSINTPGQTNSVAENKTNEESDPVETLDVSEYSVVTANDLYNYAQYMVGEKVVTLAKISDKSGASLKTKFPENDTFYFNFVFEFSDRVKIKEIDEGNTISIAGTIKDVSSRNTVTLSDCSIIGINEIPDDIIAKNDISASAEVVGEYKRLADEKAAQEQAEQAARDAQAKADYIASCETLVYSDVSRNPEQFKGKAAKVSGTVIQVQEMTLLGATSVVLRVDAGNDNIWYVTYTRPEGESRILENDWITCYGDCEGVHSYTTVLGAQVTIPSMKMRFYE